MSSRAKYAPDITWQEVQRVCVQHAEETKYEALVSVRFPLSGSVRAFAEVRLSPLGGAHFAQPTVCVRGEFPASSVSRQASAVLRLVYEAYAELERNAWLWAPEVRSRARGE